MTVIEAPVTGRSTGARGVARRLSTRFAPSRVLDAVELLATPHGLDRYLELVNPMLTVREMRARVVAAERHTADSVTLTLRPTRQWRGFRSGQYVQIAIDVDGVRRTRCYSPAGSEHRADGCIEITVKAHDDGVVSQYLYQHAAPGLVFGLSAAQGTFHLPAQRPDKVLLISGGSGITPVMSILRTLCDEGYAGELAFVHYARSAESVCYRDELRDLAAAHSNVRVAFAFTRAAGGELTGRFDPSHLKTVAPWYADAQTFLCGPQALMSEVRRHYDDLAVTDALHTEEFVLTPVAAVPGEASGTLTFARSDAAAANSGATLLEQAEAAGLTPEYGCRMGICFSCTAIKTAGCTRNIRTGDLDADPDTEIQLCVNVPVGDVTLDV
jgi:stearoyl-CoA 9-desaturase NADPH oxidoreductase